jgi:hypothetical protein
MAKTNEDARRSAEELPGMEKIAAMTSSPKDDSVSEDEEPDHHWNFY